tara:strand:- start:66 stop:353 length:288 start_codon:yes stop_codon:yes gene_type:complete
MPDWISYVGPALFVLILLAGTLFVLSRLNKFQAVQDGEHFKVKRLHSFGPRQQIVVVEYHEECYLLGVTQYSITSIAQVGKRSSEGTQLEEKVLD